MRVYLFSPIPYTFVHQRPQKIADQLRARSISVTFIEPFGSAEYLAGRKKGMLWNLFSSAFLHLLAIFSLILPSFTSRRRDRRTEGKMVAGFETVSMPLMVPANRFNSPFLER